MDVIERLPQNAFTQGEAADAGVPSRTLYRLRDAGWVEQLGRGIYRRASAPVADFDLIEVAKRRPDATVCLTSALVYHGLVDAIPATTDIALPRGQRAPRTAAAVQWHSFDVRTFGLGRSEFEVAPGETIGLYSMERSLVDVFRLRGIEGYETGVEAVKEWLKRPRARPAELLDLASKLPRASGPIRQALEYLA